MSLQELERGIFKLPASERARLAAWLNGLPPDVQEYPSQEREQMPEGYIGSAQHKADQEALREGIEDSLAGRVTPLHIVDARMRAKFNIPDNVQPFTPEELEAFEREMDALPC